MTSKPKKKEHKLSCNVNVMPSHEERLCDCGVLHFNQAIEDYEAYLSSRLSEEKILTLLPSQELTPLDMRAYAKSIISYLKGEKDEN